MLQQFADKYEYFKGSSARPGERRQAMLGSLLPCRTSGPRISLAAAHNASAGPIPGSVHPGFVPTAIQDVQTLVVVGAGRGAHGPLKLHLVTAAQRGYSSGLLEVYGTKFASRRFLKRTARPSYALKDAVPNRAASILFAEAMNTFDKCYADLGTASSVRAHWRCG